MHWEPDLTSGKRRQGSGQKSDQHLRTRRMAKIRARVGRSMLVTALASVGHGFATRLPSLPRQEEE